MNPTEQLNVAATPTESIVQQELAGFALPEGAQARVVTVVDNALDVHLGVQKEHIQELEAKIARLESQNALNRRQQPRDQEIDSKEVLKCKQEFKKAAMLAPYRVGEQPWKMFY